jgi:hypothetical protein
MNRYFLTVFTLEDMLALLQSDDEVLKETVSRDEYSSYFLTVFTLEDMLALLWGDDEVLKDIVSREEYVFFNSVHIEDMLSHLGVMCVHAFPFTLCNDN